MKVIRVGDPHAMVSNLKDCEKLVDFIIHMSKQHDVKIVEFMGDLFHTHAVIRMEVLKFWEETFAKLIQANLEVRTLVGNHDMCGSKDKEGLMSALDVFKQQIQVIDTPTIINNIGYIPYTSNIDKFVENAQKLYTEGAREVLNAHQTFVGAKYDNGFIIEDGVNLSKVPQKTVLSGHIHAMQQIEQCLYIGTPKWDTMSDANKEKGVWIFTHNDNGSIAEKSFHTTKDVVTPIYKYIVKEGEEVPELPSHAKCFLEFHGKNTWIGKMKKQYKNIAGIKGVPTDKKSSSIRVEKVNLEQFLDKYFEPIANISKSEMLDYLKEL